MDESTSPVKRPTGRRPRSVHFTLAINSLSNVLRYFVFLAVALLLTPFIVRTLGNDAYGTWVVVLALIGYANTLELGIQRAIVKLVAEKRATGDFETMNRLIATALSFFSIAGIAVLLAFIFAGPLMLRALIGGDASPDLGRTFFLTIGCDILFVFLNYVISSVLFGWQLYHRMNSVDVVMLVTRSLLIFAFLERSRLLGLAVITMLSDGAVLALALAVCKKSAPEVRFGFHGVSARSFRELLGFAGPLFVSSTAARLANETQPLIISHGMSAAYAAFFSIPKRLIQYTRDIHWAMARGFMPMFSQVERSSGNAAVREMYFRYSRFLVLAMSPILAGIYVYGAAFLGIWIGPEYQREGAIALTIMTTAYAIELSQPLLWSLFVGVGQVGVLMKISVGASILTIVASFAMVRFWGINGVAVAALAGTALSFLLFAIVLCRLLEVSLWTFLRDVHLRPLLCSGIFFGLLYACSRVLGKGSYWQLFAGVLVSMPVYVAVAYRLALSATERGWLRQRTLGRLRRVGQAA